MILALHPDTFFLGLFVCLFVFRHLCALCLLCTFIGTVHMFIWKWTKTACLICINSSTVFHSTKQMLGKLNWTPIFPVLMTYFLSLMHVHKALLRLLSLKWLLLSLP